MTLTRLETLAHAIRSKRTVSFIYDDRTRIVEVHAVGNSTKDGSVVMRGFQVAGESSRPLPAWALYTIAKMDALTLLAFPDSEAPRPGYKMDDKQMSSIIAQIELETV